MGSPDTIHSDCSLAIRTRQERVRSMYLSADSLRALHGLITIFHVALWRYLLFYLCSVVYSRGRTGVNKHVDTWGVIAYFRHHMIVSNLGKDKLISKVNAKTWLQWALTFSWLLGASLQNRIHREWLICPFQNIEKVKPSMSELSKNGLISHPPDRQQSHNQTTPSPQSIGLSIRKNRMLYHPRGYASGWQALQPGYRIMRHLW